MKQFIQALRYWVACVLVVTGAVTAGELSAEQKDAVAKLQGKGALVTTVAADTDALAVNLAVLGKGATDAELALVKVLPQVERLDLRGTGVTDAGLANLAGAAALAQLHLEKTAVTDAGLVHLKGLTNLTYLNLYGTAVTDAGLENLVGLKKLQRVYLWQTKVTDGGVAALKKALPEVMANRGEELTIAPPPMPVAMPAAAMPVNTKCPVSGKEVDPTITFSFEGKKVAFCCKDCCGKFAKDPKAYAQKIVCDVKRDTKPAATEAKPQAAKAINTKCPVSGEAVDPAVTFNYEGKTIGFCCKSCCGKFAKDAKAYADKIVADAK